jgi:hypothetical protein
MAGLTGDQLLALIVEKSDLAIENRVFGNDRRYFFKPAPGSADNNKSLETKLNNILVTKIQKATLSVGQKDVPVDFGDYSLQIVNVPGSPNKVHVVLSREKDAKNKNSPEQIKLELDAADGKGNNPPIRGIDEDLIFRKLAILDGEKGIQLAEEEIKLKPEVTHSSSGGKLKAVERITGGEALTPGQWDARHKANQHQDNVIKVYGVERGTEILNRQNRRAP